MMKPSNCITFGAISQKKRKEIGHKIYILLAMSFNLLYYPYVYFLLSIQQENISR